MSVKELGHIVLYVRDLSRSVTFYRDVLGWQQVIPELYIDVADVDWSDPAMLAGPVKALQL